MNTSLILQNAYTTLYWIVLFTLALSLFACMFRAVKGPRVADRVMAVNMMGTIVIVMISVVGFLLKEYFIIDICLIYAMISFLAVIILTQIYVGIYREKKLQSGALNTKPDDIDPEEVQDMNQITFEQEGM